MKENPSVGSTYCCCQRAMQIIQVVHQTKKARSSVNSSFASRPTSNTRTNAMKLGIIFFFLYYSVVFLGQRGLSQAEAVLLPKRFAAVVDNKAGFRVLQPSGCLDEYATYINCVGSGTGCETCIFNQLTAESCSGFSDGICAAAGGSCRPECDGCERDIEAYWRCDIAVRFPTDCPRLDCNLGNVPFLGEIPIIGWLFNFLFGWIWNLFN